jgi:hypothetical protein
MKSLTLLTLITIIFVGCVHSQRPKVSHTNHMGMRALTTKPDHEDIGCKNGHLWKQIGYDDWIDIGVVTKKCNCNYFSDSNQESFHAPKNQEVLYVVIAITDSAIYFPNGVPQFSSYDTAIFSFHRIQQDGTGSLFLNTYPQSLRARGFKITFQKADTVMREGEYMLGKF